jgi:chromosome segregation ATPase
MSCKICGRGACTESFHSLEDQEAWEERQGMSDDVETLRIECQELKASFSEMQEAFIKANNGLVELKSALREMLRRTYNEMELRKIARDALDSLENDKEHAPPLAGASVETGGEG